MIRLQCFSIKLKSLLHTTTRNIVKRTRQTTTHTEEKLKLHDNVPSGYELIYRAPMKNYLQWTKNTATGTTVVIGLVCAWQWANGTMMPHPMQTSDFALITDEEDIWYFLGGFVLINAFISMFVSRYPLRIYKNVDKYLAVYESPLPFRTILHHFKQGDVAELSHKLNPWNSISYRLGRRSSLILTDHFKTPAEFLQMRGLK